MLVRTGVGWTVPTMSEFSHYPHLLEGLYGRAIQGYPKRTHLRCYRPVCEARSEYDPNAWVSIRPGLETEVLERQTRKKTFD